MGYRRSPSSVVLGFPTGVSETAPKDDSHHDQDVLERRVLNTTKQVQNVQMRSLQKKLTFPPPLYIVGEVQLVIPVLLTRILRHLFPAQAASHHLRACAAYTVLPIPAAATNLRYEWHDVANLVRGLVPAALDQLWVADVHLCAGCGSNRFPAQLICKPKSEILPR
jgi:hypothetical protein